MVNVHESISKEDKRTHEQIESTRVSNKAYQYLCHLEESRNWIEHMIDKKYESLKEFESELCKGIDLCLLALVYAPESIKKIYYGKAKVENDSDIVLDYRYTDNIFFFISSLRTINLPEVFIFDTVSLYERKSIPSVIFCLHGLSHYLKFKGYTTKSIDSVYGMEFSKAMIEEKDEELKQKENEGFYVPEFSVIKSVMHKDAIQDILMRIKYQVYKNKVNEKEIGFVKESNKGIEFINDTHEESPDQSMHNTPSHTMTSNNSIDTAECVYKNQLNKIRVLDEIVKGLTKKSGSIVYAILKTYLHEKCFKEIMYKKNVSIYAIKYFSFVFYANLDENEKERRIEEIEEKIERERERNYKIEEYLETLDVRCNLLVNNKVNVSNISIVKPKLEDVISTQHQFEIEEHLNIFYILQNEPVYFLYLLTKNEKDNVRESAKENATKNFIITYLMPFYEKSEDKVCKMIQQGILYKDYTANSNKHDSLIFNNIDTGKEQTYNTPHTINMICFITSLLFKNGNSKLKKDILQIIKNLEKVELENDPTKICYNIFNKSIPRDEALKNETVRKIYVTRLKTLRAVILSIFTVFEKNAFDLPKYILVLLKSIYASTKDIYLVISIFYDNFVFPILIGFDLFIKSNEEIREKVNIVHFGMESIIKNKKVNLFEPLNKFFVEGKEKMKEIFKEIIKNEEKNEVCFEKEQVCFTAIQANELIKKLKQAFIDNASTQNINTEIYPFYDNFMNSLKSVILLPNNNKPVFFNLNKPLKKEKKINKNEEFVRKIKMKIVELLKIANGRNLLDLIVKQSSEEEERLYKQIVYSIAKKQTKEPTNGSNATSASNVDSSYDVSNTGSSFSMCGTSNNYNYYCRSRKEFVSIFTKNGKLIKSLSLFKDSIFDDLLILNELGISLKSNFYNEILLFLAEDILNIKFMGNERNKTLIKLKENLNNLVLKGNYLEKQMRDFENYLLSFTKFMVKKNVKNLNGKNCIFGSFKMSGKEILKKGVLLFMLCVDHSKKVIQSSVSARSNANSSNVECCDEESCECVVCNKTYNLKDTYKKNNDLVKDLDFIFMCDEPGIILVEVFMGNEMIYNQFIFRFDEILEFKRKSIKEFKIDEICIFDVNELVNLINKKFIQ